jgi:hypothetical protein
MVSGTSLAALALVMAETDLKNGEITEDQFRSFASEINCALRGKTFDERSYERTRGILDETLGPPPLRDGEDDLGEIFTVPLQRP